MIRTCGCIQFETIRYRSISHWWGFRRDCAAAARTTGFLVVLAILGIASEACAQSLPLETGYYVQSDTPCQRASNATLTLYNGISFGEVHAECRKPVIRKLAEGSYQITRRCRDVQGRGGSWETSRSSFAIRSRTEFVETTQFGTFSFRYCKQSDLPDPWNTMDQRASGLSPHGP